MNSSFAYAIVKIYRVGQSAHIHSMHVKEGNKREKSTTFIVFVSGRQRSRELIRARLFFG